MNNKFYSYSAKICLIVLIVLFLVVCSISPQQGAQPVATLTIPSEVPQTPEPVGYSTAAPPLSGPMPFPTPAKEPIAWNRLIKPELVADIAWTQSQGMLAGNNPGEQWSYSFQAPKDWQINQDPNLSFVSVQNTAEISGTIQGPFAKFEIVRLKETPSLPEGGIFIPSDFKTVTMLGNPAVLYTRIDEPDQLMNFTIVFQHNDAWFVGSGYVFLPEANENEMERYQSILLTMASSFQFTD